MSAPPSTPKATRRRAARTTALRLVLGGSGVLLLGLSIAGCSSQTTPPEAAEPFVFQTALSTNTILIGQPATLTLDTTHPTNVQVRLPELGRDRDVVVRDVRQETEPGPDGLARTSVSILFTSMKVGSHVLSSNEVTFVGGDAEPVVRPFPFVAFDVLSTLTEDAEARGAKPIHTWPGRVPLWIVGLAGVALLAFLIGSLVAWQLRKPATVHAPPLPPPHVTALEALGRLKAKEYIREGKLEPFYVELSDIVRLYLERRFRLHAPEQTTEEFIRAATESHLLSDGHQDLTHRFLEQCDLVKFARARPGVPEMEAAFEAGETLVVETAEKEEQAA